jgi:hypothetical protein
MRAAAWPVPHAGPAGIEAGERCPRPDDTPTIPGLDNSFARFVPWHAGHAGGRLAVTSASNGFRQSLHSYS